MPLTWRKQWISDETFESCGVFDVNGDGIPDIVSGSFWYEGPTFRTKHFIGDVLRSGEYCDAFSEIPLDVNGDGRMDFITGGWWGGNLRWRENPGEAGAPWVEHVIAETGNIETTRAWDIDGCGTPEIVPNTPCNPEVLVFKLDKDGSGKGKGTFTKHVIHTFAQGQGHGQGCGNIAGNGRMDMAFRNGWLEAPANPWKEPWIWYGEYTFEGAASNPILVTDLTGNGLGDLIIGNAHGYGLDWYELRREGGKRVWIRHPIDPFNAQYHDLQWADIDGDGHAELVTGKRHRAHCGGDAGEWDDVGIYYFKWTGEGFAKQVVDYGSIGTGKGVGIFFQLVDLNGNGRLDLVAPGKDGLYVYWNEGASFGSGG